MDLRGGRGNSERRIRFIIRSGSGRVTQQVWRRSNFIMEFHLKCELDGSFGKGALSSKKHQKYNEICAIVNDFFYKKYYYLVRQK